MKNIILGILLGIANITPGVSAGIIAVSFNVYDKLIEMANDIKSSIKNEKRFIIELVIGAIIGVVLFSRVIDFLVNSYPVATSFFFMGVILGSVPFIYGKTKGTGVLKLIPFVIALIIMVITSKMGVEKAGGNTSFIMLIVYGVIIAVCGVIPGMSTSFVLMAMGGYTVVIEAISNFQIPKLMVIAIGGIAGLIFATKLINKLIHNYKGYTYSAILGFVIGSLVSVYPGYSLSDGILPFILLISGTVITYFSNAKE